MSTILPLEVVYGRSTWSLQAEDHEVVRGYDPSSLFGIRFVTQPSIGVSPRTTYSDFHQYGDPFNAPFERIPHREGPLGDGWDAHDEFLKSSGRPQYADYQNNYFKPGLYFLDVWTPDGRFGVGVWGQDIVAGYKFISPFVNNEDGTFLRPFDNSDVTAPYEEEFLTGECGDGGGSERPESGLLYPRKV